MDASDGAKAEEIRALHDELAAGEALARESSEQFEARLCEKEEEAGRLKLQVEKFSEEASVLRAELNVANSANDSITCKLSELEGRRF
jgi:hypothetical protein